MAVDMFIKLAGIEGESKDKTHGKEIDVLAWSWGISQSGSFHHGGGGGAGKANFQDLSFTKWIDKSSPILMLHVANGKHIDQVDLVVRKAGENPLEYLKIKLEKVIVSSYSTGGSGGEDKLTENVSLNFAKVTINYQEQNATGGKEGGEIPFTWDIEANVK
jgi:type VI secretion system secreted protein Hcp